MSGRSLAARERRTIATAIVVLAAGLIGSRVVVPVVREWNDREAQIDLVHDRLARLNGLALYQDSLVLAADQSMSVPLPRRILRGRTPALAASELQGMLQEYARLSRVSISRLDVASSSENEETTAATPFIPASISATTDIYGLADLLSRIETGELALDVSELSVAPNAALRGELLQIALVVRAPLLLEP